MLKTTEIENEDVPKSERMRNLLMDPLLVIRELNNRSFFHFLEYFWDEVCTQPFQSNWHIEYLCTELQQIAERVGARQPRKHDLIINIPPGMTKTLLVSIMFPVWCWTRWYWMRFITASYSLALSLESAEYCRDILRSDRFKRVYPDITIRSDKDVKSNFKIVKLVEGLKPEMKKEIQGGNRYSTSVGGTLTGFHGDILIWDDPLNPHEAASDVKIAAVNRWIDETLPTRKTDKSKSTTIGIMQRLHQNDPTGHILSKGKQNVKHVCLPGECINYGHKVTPPELIERYVDGLLDPRRLNHMVLKDLEKDLGPTGFSGQIGQHPTPPGGGMFKVDHFQIVLAVPEHDRIVQTIRYWDKAGTSEAGAYTAGTKISKLRSGRFIIEDIRRGQWAAELRERIMLETAINDGQNVHIFIEQEPGSGGKDSAQSTIRNLAGFAVYAERPTGKKEDRALPYAIQVNNGNVLLLQGAWNNAFIEEHRFFPYSKYKDQVDASSGGFNQLAKKKIVRRIT